MDFQGSFILKHLNSIKRAHSSRSQAFQDITNMQYNESLYINQTVFDKLNDPKQFTGTHKFRFDENGKGLGKQGRDSNYDPKDLQNLVSRSNLSNQIQLNNQESQKLRSFEIKPKKMPRVFEKLTDKKFYTGVSKKLTPKCI